MIDFAGALVASFVLGFIIGLRLRRQSAVVYVVLFLLVLAVSYFVGNYPFYTFVVNDMSIPVNLVFITSFLGLVFGSFLLRGGNT
jgi:lipopolysaccharide export LptBFGC system permease protein LptF